MHCAFLNCGKWGEVSRRAADPRFSPLAKAHKIRYYALP